MTEEYKKTWTIYVIVNVINGKKYVGITSNGLKKRVMNHFAAAKRGEKYKFYQAIRKYGQNNFEADVICTSSSLLEAQELERVWIATFNSNKKGYNSTCGGGGVPGKWTDARRKKRIANYTSEERKAKKEIIAKWRKNLNEEQKKAMSDHMKNKFSAPSYQAFFKEHNKKSWTPERRNAQAERMRDRNKANWGDAEYRKKMEDFLAKISIKGTKAKMENSLLRTPENSLCCAIDNEVK